VVTSGSIGAIAWLLLRVISPDGRLATFGVTAVVGGAAATAYVGVLHLSGARLALRPASGAS
jgi:hypothetical protein